MDLRNPFGLCDGQIVLIEDIPRSMNGLRCNCVCPACKEPFEARMGDVRRHHFAHSGQGCDEINAYLAGLYMLLNEYLSSGQSLYLPPVIVAFELSGAYYLTESNIYEHIALLSSSINERYEIKLYNSTWLRFNNTHIIENSKGRPQAILAEACGRQLAIKITPPDTVCKFGKVTRYKNYSTLEIDLSDAADMIQNSQKTDIFKYLMLKNSIYRWIYNPRIIEAFPEIIERSKVYYYNDAQIRMKQEEEKRKSEAARREDAVKKQAEKFRKEQEERQKKAEFRNQQEADSRRFAAEKRKQQREANEKKEILHIHQETGGYVGDKVNGKYNVSTLKEITSTRPINWFGEYTLSDFESRIAEIQEFRQSGVRMLFAKMCYINQDETKILLQIYNELKGKDPETAHVIDYLMQRAGVLNEDQ